MRAAPRIARALRTPPETSRAPRTSPGTHRAPRTPWIACTVGTTGTRGQPRGLARVRLMVIHVGTSLVPQAPGDRARGLAGTGLGHAVACEASGIGALSAGTGLARCVSFLIARQLTPAIAITATGMMIVRCMAVT